MFRRSRTAEETPPSSPAKQDGKGRPTPSRRDAQAAARVRAKGPTDKKEAARLQRQRRNDSGAKMHEAMRTGDDRFLPNRDKGPVRRFVRDWVDSRLCMSELLLPLLLVVMVSSTFSPSLSTGLWEVVILLVALDTSWLVFRLRRELARRFPDTSTKGAVGYAVLRAIQVRFLRMPKTQVKLGGKLRERY